MAPNGKTGHRATAYRCRCGDGPACQYWTGWNAESDALGGREPLFSKRGGRDRERALAAGARPRRACPVRRGATADTSRRLRRRRDLPPGPRSSHLLIRDRGAPEAHRARHRTTAHDPAAHEPAEPGRGPCASPGDRGPRDTESSVSDRPSAKRHDASPRTSGAGSPKPGSSALGSGPSVATARSGLACRRSAHRRRRAAAALASAAAAGDPAHASARGAASRGVRHHHEPLLRELRVPGDPRRSDL